MVTGQQGGGGWKARQVADTKWQIPDANHRLMAET